MNNKITWCNATAECHPIDYKEKEFKYSKWYEIMVITKDGKVISDIFYNDGKLYRDFDGIFSEESQDWNTMSISNDEGNFKLPWTKVAKWCYMEDVIEQALEDFDPKYISKC